MANEDDSAEFVEFENMYKSPALRLAPRHLNADRNVLLHKTTRSLSSFPSSNVLDEDATREPAGYDGLEVEGQDVASDEPRSLEDEERAGSEDKGTGENAESFVRYFFRVLAIK